MSDEEIKTPEIPIENIETEAEEEITVHDIRRWGPNMLQKELNVDIGIRKPKEYDYSSLDECIKFVERLESYDGLLHEGFVVVDKDYHRVKIKSTSYLAMHRAIDNHKVFTLKRAIEIIRANCIERYRDFPIEYEYLKKVEYDVVRMRKEIYEYLLYAINLFEENNREKKAFALALRDDKFKFLAFEAIKQENLDVVKFIDNWFDNVQVRPLGTLKPLGSIEV